VMANGDRLAVQINPFRHGFQQLLMAVNEN
jgi:hypothetical protein